MATRAQPVEIGPFTGGINTFSDPTAIADDECADILNFDIDIDGSLVSRPPVSTLTTINGSRGMRLIGVFSTDSGYNWLIFTRVASNTAGYPTGTYAYDLKNGTILTIASFSATVMVQYQKRAWLVAPVGSPYDGGSWDGNVFTAVTTLPQGATAVVYKERLFIGTGAGTTPNRVYFSNAANFGLWTGTDFFDVHNGDGQKIIRMYVVSGSIAVFKTGSTYVFAYESAPAKGQIQLVSGSLGVDNYDCVVENNNVIYVTNNLNVYAISNWNWQQINSSVPFAFRDGHTGNSIRSTTMSSVGDRIIVRYYDNYYVFGTKTGVWSRWTSNLTFDYFVPSPLDQLGTSRRLYYAGNFYSADDPAAFNIFKMYDGYIDTDTTSELFLCSVTTKTISLNSPYSFKRLMWWGADIFASTSVQATLIPAAVGTPVRWRDITALNLKWSDRAVYTWGNPLTKVLDVSDSAAVPNYTNVRIFLKFIKSIRFRQLQFKLSSTVGGTSQTGPFRVFSITAFVINKETVGKKIN